MTDHLTASAVPNPENLPLVDVVVNGTHYVQEETLFAAMRELDALRRTVVKAVDQLERADCCVASELALRILRGPNV